jgi:hypothetical protein
MTNDLKNDRLKNIKIRHYNCLEKPWSHFKFEGKEIKNYNDFWFFASLTPFYAGLKQKYESSVLENSITELNNRLQSDMKNLIHANIFRSLQIILPQIIQKTEINTVKIEPPPHKNGLLEALRCRVKIDNEKKQHTKK